MSTILHNQNSHLLKLVKNVPIASRGEVLGHLMRADAIEPLSLKQEPLSLSRYVLMSDTNKLSIYDTKDDILVTANSIKCISPYSIIYIGEYILAYTSLYCTVYDRNLCYVSSYKPPKDGELFRNVLYYAPYDSLHYITYESVEQSEKIRISKVNLLTGAATLLHDYFEVPTFDSYGDVSIKTVEGYTGHDFVGIIEGQKGKIVKVNVDKDVKVIDLTNSILLPKVDFEVAANNIGAIHYINGLYFVQIIATDYDSNKSILHVLDSNFNTMLTIPMNDNSGAESLFSCHYNKDMDAAILGLFNEKKAIVYYFNTNKYVLSTSIYNKLLTLSRPLFDNYIYSTNANGFNLVDYNYEVVGELVPDNTIVVSDTVGISGSYINTRVIRVFDSKRHISVNPIIMACSKATTCLKGTSSNAYFVLSSRPTRNITYTIKKDTFATGLTVNTASITFTPDDYCVPKAVSVSVAASASSTVSIVISPEVSNTSGLKHTIRTT